MKKLIKIIAFVISLLNVSNLSPMNQPNQPGNITPGNITRTIDGIMYTYEPQANVLSCVIGGTRYVLRHPRLHDQQFYAANAVTGIPIPLPAGADGGALINLLMPRLEEIQHQAPAAAPQQNLAASARAFFLRWGLPIRFDVGLREALRDEGRRFMAAWNRPALKSFFIFLGEAAVFCVLLQISSSFTASGGYSSEINNRLIPSLSIIINPDEKFSRYIHDGNTYFTPATRLVGLRETGESLMCLYMMTLIQSNIAALGLHTTEDLFCSIGRVVWAYLQGLFVGQAQPQGHAHQD